jgi:hypothetical protein
MIEVSSEKLMSLDSREHADDFQGGVESMQILGDLKILRSAQSDP